LKGTVANNSQATWPIANTPDVRQMMNSKIANSKMGHEERGRLRGVAL